MNPQTIFSLANGIAMIGWIILVFFPFWFSSDKFVISIIIVLLAILYLWLIARNFQLGDISKFSSVEGVSELFSNRELLVAGWVHYLAFDLLAGTFIRRNALLHGISHWLVIPCLLLTFMLGPVGLLIYLLMRTVKTKNLFPTNYKI